MALTNGHTRASKPGLVASETGCRVIRSNQLQNTHAVEMNRGCDKQTLAPLSTTLAILVIDYIVVCMSL